MDSGQGSQALVNSLEIVGKKAASAGDRQDKAGVTLRVTTRSSGQQCAVVDIPNNLQLPVV